jgi:hypothetical protein
VPAPKPAPPKPKSNQNIPAAKPAPPERRRKKRTGVKIPEAPLAEPMPAASPFAVPVAPSAAEQFDVELVDEPAPPVAARPRSTKRDLLIFGAGIGVMLVLYGFCTVISWVLSFFRGE